MSDDGMELCPAAPLGCGGAGIIVEERHAYSDDESDTRLCGVCDGRGTLPAMWLEELEARAARRAS